jgi:hypothetical protein
VPTTFFRSQSPSAAGHCCGGQCHKAVLPSAPHLVITQSVNGIPMQGKCSSCKDATFQTVSDDRNADQHESLLNKMFDNHFKRVHSNEDAEQATARKS